MEEIEIKFLEIDKNEVEKKLINLGAKKVLDILFRRRVFDFPNLSLANNHSWLRLRDEGEKITLTFKKRLGVGEELKDEGMHEIEVEVNNFEGTAKILNAIGMQEKFYEENKRLKYELNGVEFCIDEWPLIPAYLEIEGKSWANVQNAVKILDLDWNGHKRCSTMQVYKNYGIEENDYSILTFEKQVKK